MNTTLAPSQPSTDTLNQRLRQVITVHFDPDGGSAYWLDRAQALGLDPRRDIHHLADLGALGDMTPADLQARPLTDYIPRRFHHRLDRFILGQTGGAIGAGTWTAYRDDEFIDAFVLPFADAANRIGFPSTEQWLYIGPTGPHIIGKAVRHLAVAMGSPDPFAVDFDPRWANRLPQDSPGRLRYTRHVLDQALAVMNTQPVGVLFATPPLLDRLAHEMSDAQRRRIRGVHYGGTAITPDQMQRFQNELFPYAVHLAGYGNTLFGCCLQHATGADQPLDYFTHGSRLILEVVDEQGTPMQPGQTGRVRFTRLDESMLIIHMLERDQAEPVNPPDTAPTGLTLPGVRNPRPFPQDQPTLATGLY